MEFLRKVDRKTRKDKMKNSFIKNKFSIKPILRKEKNTQLRWLEYIHTISEEKLTKMFIKQEFQGANRRGTPRQS